GVQIAQLQLAVESELDASDSIRYLSGDKLEPAPRGLVIEQDAGAGEDPVTLAVVHRDPVTVKFGHSVGAARVKARPLILRALLYGAEHLAGRCLVKANPRVHHPYGLQQARDTERRKLAGEHWLVPGRGHEGLGCKVIHLLGFTLLERGHHGTLVQKVARKEFDAVLKMDETLEIDGARAPHQPVD